MKTFKVISFVALSIGLVSCSNTTEISEIPKDVGNRFNGIDASEIKIITDSKTNCKYIYVEDGQGNYKTTAMSPLYVNYNTVDCTK